MDFGVFVSYTVFSRRGFVLGFDCLYLVPRGKRSPNFFLSQNLIPLSQYNTSLDHTFQNAHCIVDRLFWQNWWYTASLVIFGLKYERTAAKMYYEKKLSSSTLSWQTASLLLSTGIFVVKVTSRIYRSIPQLILSSRLFFSGLQFSSQL